MADNIGINMHTVNKAYTVLKQEGFVKLDRRKGAVVSLDVDKIQVLDEMRRDLSVVLARGVCKNVTCEEMHQLVDEIFQSFITDQREE
jgi:DNA-binding transcriptional regulator YhcF (GntR family)